MILVQQELKIVYNLAGKIDYLLPMVHSSIIKVIQLLGEFESMNSIKIKKRKLTDL